MEFDESNVFTLLNADAVNIGSKGYFADNLKDLKEAVEHGERENYGEIEAISCEADSCRFSIKKGSIFALFYLVKEPKEEKLRPYNDTNEMIDHFNKHFELIPQKYRLSILWVKDSSNTKYLITRVSEGSVTLTLETVVYTISLRTLFDDYTWLDGSPCGIEEA